MAFSAGDHVMAHFTGEGPPVLSHVVSGPIKNEAGETKFKVQAPDGGTAHLSHREPEDRDAEGSGGTFWKL